MNEQSGSKEWLRLPQRCLHDKDLNLYDVIVLAVIVDYVDGESKPMSVDKIAQKAGLSERQVQISIKNLVANKYIEAERRAGKKTVFTQCDVLPPKRQSQKKAQKKSSLDADFDVEEYKCLVNDI